MVEFMEMFAWFLLRITGTMAVLGGLVALLSIGEGGLCSRRKAELERWNDGNR